MRGRSMIEVNRPILQEALQKLNVVRVRVEYSGSGDEGQVNGVYLYNAAGHQVDSENVQVAVQEDRGIWRKDGFESAVTERQVDLENALQNFTYDLLEGTHPGWEINEGSEGSLDVDVAKAKWTLNHGDRVEHVEWSEEDV